MQPCRQKRGEIIKMFALRIRGALASIINLESKTKIKFFYKLLQMENTEMAIITFTRGL